MYKGYFRASLSHSFIGFLIGATLCTQLSSTSVFGKEVLLDRLEASINSSMVLRSDVTEFRKTLPLRLQLDPLFANTNLAKRRAGDLSLKEIVEFMIEEKLILSEFPIEDSEVDQEIKSIEAANNVTREQLTQALEQQGFDFDHYFELIRISAAKRNLIDREIRTKVSISDDDVKNYYYNTYTSSRSAAKAYKVKIISISPSNYKSPDAAKEIAERALRQIRSGEPFEEVAKRVSDDPSAPSGGDLGTLSSDDISSTIRNELEKLKIGEVSNVLGSASTRYYILKLDDISSTQGHQFERVKEEIRARLTTEEYQRQISLWLDRQKSSAFIRRYGDPSIRSTSSSPSKS